MTTERDMDDDMKRSGLDDLTADRLLAGRIAPQDAPRGYQAIAEAIQRASDPGTATDSQREHATVASMVETLRSVPSAYTPVWRRSKIARSRGVKVAAIAAVVLVGATAAGAATDSLPGPAQRAISDAASHLGLSLPKPTPGHAGKPVGPNAADRARYGLCRAYAAGPSTTNPHSRKDRSVAFANLQKAAGAAGMSVAAYCKNAVAPTGGNRAVPETDTTVARGPNATVPPVSTPHATGPPVSTPQPKGPPVSAPQPTEPPVSTPRPTGPPASTTHSTGPPASTQGDPHRP
jgi:hypothetical protein